MAALEGIKVVLDSTHHFPGSVVKGRVLVNVDEPRGYKHIFVTFWRGNSNWLYNNREFPNGDFRLDNQATTLWKANRDLANDDIPVGEHSFGFSFSLPSTITPTYKGPHGSSKYEVEATIVQTLSVNTTYDFEHKITAEFVISDRVSNLLGVRNAPETADETKYLMFCCCLNRGSISVTVNVPRTGFSPGDVVPITVSLKNESSSSLHVVSSIIRRDRFSPDFRRKDILSTIAKTKTSHIVPGPTSFEDRCLRIPTGVDNVITTVRSCSSISVEYSLEVIVEIPWSSNLKVYIPLVVMHWNDDSPAAAAAAAAAATAVAVASAPVAPVAFVAPLAPVASAPVAPVAFVAPLAPLAPLAPVAPLAPLAVVLPSPPTYLRGHEVAVSDDDNTPVASLVAPGPPSYREAIAL